MSFIENLKQKITIDRLSQRVIHSLGPVGSGEAVFAALKKSVLALPRQPAVS